MPQKCSVIVEDCLTVFEKFFNSGDEIIFHAFGDVRDLIASIASL